MLTTGAKPDAVVTLNSYVAVKSFDKIVSLTFEEPVLLPLLVLVVVLFTTVLHDASNPIKPNVEIKKLFFFIEIILQSYSL